VLAAARIQPGAIGLLVLLGFGVTAFTPAAYQRGSLPRPSRRPHLGEGFALRCLQRLSRPHLDTLPCGWRRNRFTSGASRQFHPGARFENRGPEVAFLFPGPDTPYPGPCLYTIS